MSRYSVTTLDLCVQGFERLRSNREFILTAYPGQYSLPEEIVESLREDIQSCMRPDDFDFDAAREAVDSYFDEGTRALLARELLGIDWPEEEPEISDFPLTLFLYVRDNAEDPPANI
jgi:hypothetical protein